ncbi:MAG: cupin domain-containing protein [Ensifer adhaerens]
MPLDTDEAPAADAGAPLTDMPAAATIGQMLRARRKEIGKTMKQVAREAGLTEGFISQIERGISTPSLISLYNVANALGTSVDTFLSQPPQHAHSIVSHAGERRGYNVETKERVYELLERGFPGAQLNGCITHMPAGYASELTSHDGEDFLYLIEGEMLYEIDGKEYVLKAGDTLHFPSSLPHRARNIGAGPARELWVGTTRIIAEE